VRSSIILATAAVLATATLAEQPGPSMSRDSIWRGIFAREPVPSSGGASAIDVARGALGKMLFSDTRLSGDGTRSCRTCHQPSRGFTDGIAKGMGRDGTPLNRNTPHLWNLAWAKSFYWDGREPTLEQQARVPLTAANELGGNFKDIIARLSVDDGMTRAFARAFPSSPAIAETSILQVLADYERSLVSPKTRFDAWVEGDDGALTQSEKQGFDIFVGKGGCVSCHGGWRFTDDAFHDIGLPGSDPGRGGIAGGTPGLPAFKTPGLRELAQTAPYMHDGSLTTLSAVIDHYVGAKTERPSLSPNIVRDLTLTRTDKEALIAFLLTLSSESPEPPRGAASPKP
jgi:cytochrome c peroxidase